MSDQRRNGLFELLGQMMRLPFATLAYVLEAMAETASGAGRLTDQGVDRMLRPNGTPAAPPSGPPRWRNGYDQTTPGASAAGEDGYGFTQRGAASPGAEAKEKEEHKMPDTNLSDDSVKLVHYVVVSIERDNERILPRGEGYRIVTDNMTAEAFAAWTIAHYFQTKDHEELAEDEKKYLRVCYEVRCRWARESLHYESKQLTRLEGIEDAVRDLGDRLSGTSPTAPRRP